MFSPSIISTSSFISIGYAILTLHESQTSSLCVINLAVFEHLYGFSLVQHSSYSHVCIYTRSFEVYCQPKTNICIVCQAILMGLIESKAHDFNLRHMVSDNKTLWSCL